MVALLRLSMPIVDRNKQLPICETRGRQGDLMGVCGMGSISREKELFRTTLQEALFTISFLKKGYIPFLEPLHFCEQHNICTDKIGVKLGRLSAKILQDSCKTLV
ncbi:uncharacterized protein LOC142355778 [Convolutriloba macropyga]|uniref:uncharacterized protein LOC142355778 n=1 Tax=Convolutriloba macropyga TaxID=536237 RepID=UPI003F51BD14